MLGELAQPVTPAKPAKIKLAKDGIVLMPN